jgi:hypothetical protein
MDNPIAGDERISPVELAETSPVLSLPERLEAFALIDRSVAAEMTRATRRVLLRRA